LERRGELRTLKSLGMSRRDVARAVAIEGVIIGAVGLGAGLVLSVALGWLLIYVINKQTFGWTLAFKVPGLELLSLSVLVLLTSGSVAYIVGKWAANLPIDQEE
jgi:putative ABC transport system permease protein